MLIIRPSTDADLADITDIYAYHVLNGTGTFEVEPPSVQDMGARRSDVLSKGLPWLVAVDGGKVIDMLIAIGSNHGQRTDFQQRTPFICTLQPVKKELVVCC